MAIAALQRVRPRTAINDVGAAARIDEIVAKAGIDHIRVVCSLNFVVTVRRQNGRTCDPAHQKRNHSKHVKNPQVAAMVTRIRRRAKRPRGVLATNAVFPRGKQLLAPTVQAPDQTIALRHVRRTRCLY